VPRGRHIIAAMIASNVRLSLRGLSILAAGFAVLTIAFTHPQALYLTTQVSGHFDSLFSVWRLAWVAHQIVSDPLRLFDANIFFPERMTLAYSDAMLLPGVVLAPLAWSGLSPVAIYNFAVLASFVLSATAAALLGWKMTGRIEAGIVTGMIFGFAPHRFDHFSHLELLLNWWMPLAFVALHHALKTGKPRAYAALAACLIFQVLSCIYHGLFLTVCIGAAAVTAIATGQATSIRKHVPGVAWLAVAAGVFLLYSLPYQANRQVVGERPLEEIALYSAKPSDFIATPPENVLYGSVMSRFGKAERFLFPGVLASSLAVIGLFSRRRRALLVWVVTLWIATELSLGINGLIYPVLYNNIEVFHGLRAPARAGILILLSVAALAALGAEVILGKFRQRNRQLVVIGAIVCGMGAEYFSRVQLVPLEPPPAIYRILQDEPHAVILELPVARPEALAPMPEALYMYYSTTHWKSLLNGYSGFYPKNYVLTLETLRNFPDEASLAFLETEGVTHLVLHRDFWFGDLEYDETVDALREQSVPLVVRTAGVTIFSLPRKVGN
jgi:hypothetical protein